MGNRRTDTIAALLSAAPPIVESTPHDRNGNEADPQVSHIDDTDLDDSDLEDFHLEAGVPLVKPRRRRQVSYQTVRINKPTAQVLRQQWIVAKHVDPLLSYVEFATIVTQRGLQALAEERRRLDG